MEWIEVGRALIATFIAHGADGDRPGSFAGSKQQTSPSDRKAHRHSGITARSAAS